MKAKVSDFNLYCEETKLGLQDVKKLLDASIVVLQKARINLDREDVNLEGKDYDLEAIKNVTEEAISDLKERATHFLTEYALVFEEITSK